MTIMKTDSIDGEDAIESLEIQGLINKYICLFINKNMYINDDYEEGGYVYFYENESEDIDVYIEDIFNKINIKPDNDFNITNIIHEVEDIYFDNLSEKVFLNTTNPYNNQDVYLKNIKISHFFQNLIIEKCLIKGTIINIKDNLIKSDIARKSLLENSKKQLNEIIFRIIHEYVLENFDLTAEEKILIQKFIDEFYPVKSILLK